MALVLRALPSLRQSWATPVMAAPMDLGYGLRFLGVPRGSRFWDRAVNNNRGFAATASTTAMGLGGPGGYNASAVFTNAATTDLEFTSGPWSVWIYGAMTSLTNGSWFGRRTYTSESANAGWNMESVSNNGSISFASYANNDQSFYGLYAPSAYPIGDIHIIGTSDGTTRTLYVNGRRVATGTNNPNHLTTSGGLVIGGGSTRIIYICGVWGRCLKVPDVWALYANPWALLRPPRMAMRVPTAAGGATPVRIKRLFLMGAGS